MSITSIHIISIIGLASNSLVKKIEIKSEDLNLTLMEYLRRENIPIASSCYGEGICKKCVVKLGEVEELSCLISVKKLLEMKILTISISYL